MAPQDAYRPMSDLDTLIKSWRNILDNKLHEYYFAVNSFLEFPEIKEHEVRQLIYDEFGKRDKTFEVQVMTSLAKKQADGRNNYDN